MKPTPSADDLIVLVADTDMLWTMKTLLDRPEVLGAACFGFHVEKHPGRDAGCRNDAVEFLRRYLGKYNHCMVIFDHHGCGSRDSRDRIQARLGETLARNGWGSRASAIVIQPELEAWFWGDLAAASSILGWAGDHQKMRAWLTARGLWPDGVPKPPRPKKAMRETIRRTPSDQRVRRTARIFQKMAAVAKVDECRDPAFQDLLATLRRWFPTPETHR